MRTRFAQFVVTVAVASAVIVFAPSLLAPVVVNAATGTTMNITDPGFSARKARVTANGQLTVAEIDPVSSSPGRVSNGARWVGDGSGALTVDGTVGARPVVPASPWNQVEIVTLSASNLRQPLFSRTGTTKLALTSMSFASIGPTAETTRIRIAVYMSNSAAGDCDTLTGATFGLVENFVASVKLGDMATLTWPTPLVYTTAAQAGRLYCVDAEFAGAAPPVGSFIHISATGFTY